MVHMSVPESFIVGLICLFIVFLVLAALFILVRILSAMFQGAGRKKPEVPEAIPAAETAVAKVGVETVQATSGELKLLNVDEKTAAMIMAIVSDESQIPLSELSFKSIKAID